MTTLYLPHRFSRLSAILRNALVISWPALALFLCVGVFSNVVHSAENIESSKTLPIANWVLLSRASEDHNKPIVLLIERSDCRYCETVRHNYLQPMSGAKRFRDTVLFRRVNVDAGQTIIGHDGKSISGAAFCAKYEACFSPTILFLNSAQEEIAPRMIGFAGADYYGYYLEQGIDAATDALAEGS